MNPDGHLIKLWLDDVRDPVSNGHIGWTWVTSVEDAVSLLDTGLVFKASLDHDLCDASSIGLEPTEPTGFDFACYMEERNLWPPGGVKCHSQNPFGKKCIEAVIRRNQGK